MLAADIINDVKRESGMKQFIYLCVHVELAQDYWQHPQCPQVEYFGHKQM